MKRATIRRAAAEALLMLALGAGAVALVDAAPAPAPAPVNINTATVEALISVPGIGPVLAQRIVELREKIGPFRAVDGLLKVQGIGEKSLAKMRPYLTVGQ